MGHRTIAGILISALVALSMWVVVSSEIFQGCVQSEKSHPSEYHSIKGVSQPRSAFDLYKFCAGTFLEKNGEAVTAFFTIVLAISTIGLWLTTNRLYETGEQQMALIEENAVQQAADMEKSIAAAQESARAAMLAIGSGRAWMLFDDIVFGIMSNGTFNGVPFKNGVSFTVRWFNSGSSPAIQTIFFTDFAIVRYGTQEVPSFNPNWNAVETTGTAPVRPNRTMSAPPRASVDAELESLFRKEKAIILFSAARYRDVFNPNVDRFSEACVRIEFAGVTHDDKGGKDRPYWDITAVGLQNTAT